MPNRERRATVPTRKRIIILAGPNGAGKTTFAREFLPDEADCPAFVNADLIAAGLSPFNPEADAMRAGRIMLELIYEHVSRGDSFAFETTLAGKGLLVIPGLARGWIPRNAPLFGVAVCGGCSPARSRASCSGRPLRSRSRGSPALFGRKAQLQARVQATRRRLGAVRQLERRAHSAKLG